MMKITLYTNPFVHDHTPHVGVMVMVRDDAVEKIVGCYSMQGYATPKNTYDVAMQAYWCAHSTERLLVELGRKVEVEEVLRNSSAIIERLNEQVRT